MTEVFAVVAAPSCSPASGSWPVGSAVRVRTDVCPASGASDAAREALKVAAGISVPKGEFVLRLLALAASALTAEGAASA